MGATKNSEKSNFYFVKDQKFRKNAEPGTLDAIQETVGDKTFHYEEFGSINGKVNHIFINEEGEGAKKYQTMCIQLMDGDTKENATMYFNGGEAVSFLRRLPNIDLSRPVEIMIRRDKKEKDGKTYVNGRLDVYQKSETSGDNQLVEMFYTQTNPLPAWVALVKGDGSGTWDKTAQEAFLEKLVDETNAKISSLRKTAEVSATDVNELQSIQSEEFKIANEADLKSNPALSGVIWPKKEVKSTENPDDLPF